MIDIASINKTIWAIDDPTVWAQRYSNRVTVRPYLREATYR